LSCEPLHLTLMRTTIGISILLLMVSVQTPFGQLLKLPLLVEHFLEHKEKQRISFRYFIQDHYTGSHSDTDLPDDEQLPFKSISLYNIGYAMMPGQIVYKVYFGNYPADKIKVADSFIRCAFAGNIFHPPKVWSTNSCTDK
jgi:hypothetical protein